MPEAYRYAFAVTFSMPQDLTDEMCHEFIRLCKKAEYYAVVFELDENGRKHAHAGVLYKLARKAWPRGATQKAEGTERRRRGSAFQT